MRQGSPAISFTLVTITCSKWETVKQRDKRTYYFKDQHWRRCIIACRYKGLVESSWVCKPNCYWCVQGAIALNSVRALLPWGCHICIPLPWRKAQMALLVAKLWRTVTNNEALLFCEKSQQIFFLHRHKRKGRGRCWLPGSANANRKCSPVTGNLFIVVLLWNHHINFSPLWEN